jgi:hypothetical protein
MAPAATTAVTMPTTEIPPTRNTPGTFPAMATANVTTTRNEYAETLETEILPEGVVELIAL